MTTWRGDMGQKLPMGQKLHFQDNIVLWQLLKMFILKKNDPLVLVFFKSDYLGEEI